VEADDSYSRDWATWRYRQHRLCCPFLNDSLTVPDSWKVSLSCSDPYQVTLCAGKGVGSHSQTSNLPTQTDDAKPPPSPPNRYQYLFWLEPPNAFPSILPILRQCWRDSIVLVKPPRTSVSAMVVRLGMAVSVQAISKRNFLPADVDEDCSRPGGYFYEPQ